jgi:hypothetical protein
MTMRSGDRAAGEIGAAPAGAGALALARTKILAFRCSTTQQATGVNAGASSASPVRRLKQA